MTPKPDKKILQLTADTLAKHNNNMTAAALELKIPRGSMWSRMEVAKRMGVVAGNVKPLPKQPKRQHSDPTDVELKEMLRVVADCGGKISGAAARLDIPEPTLRTRISIAQRRKLVTPTTTSVTDALQALEGVKNFLLGHHHKVDTVLKHFSLNRRAFAGLLRELEGRGYNVFQRGEDVSIERQPVPKQIQSPLYTFPSTKEGYYKFGLISDTHYGSKYCREDVAEKLYDWFAEEGIKRVYHSGNFIDGETHFNKFDLKVHGMHAQVDYFTKHYPQREGITTFFVAGDDHEGWYSQKTGVDIGKYTENHARDHYKRQDLRYLGYVEAFIALKHARTGAVAQMLVQHPGGGSAYATSYAPQKAVESLQGGEKPAVWVFGHWHKIFDLLIRNVICLGAGCTKDLDPFGRKNKIAYHVGGLIVELWQDEKGAIVRWRTEKMQFFDRGYYNDQFSMSGPVLTPGDRS